MCEVAYHLVINFVAFVKFWTDVWHLSPALMAVPSGACPGAWRTFSKQRAQNPPLPAWSSMFRVQSSSSYPPQRTRFPCSTGAGREHAQGHEVAEGRWKFLELLTSPLVSSPKSLQFPMAQETTSRVFGCSAVLIRSFLGYLFRMQSLQSASPFTS